jgi:acetyltransferase
LFGHGGTAVEVINDKALGLPPLDLNLAHELIARTRVSRVLGAYRNMPAVRQAEVALTLVKLARLAADLPEVRELDINPLLADESGVLALDARVSVGPLDTPARGSGHPRFAIRPYPSGWEQRITIDSIGKLLIRPIRPEDEALYPDFLRLVSPEDLRLRFFGPLKDFSHAFIARLTQIDYARAMAFAAIAEDTGKLLGVVRLHADPNYEVGEFAILLRSDLRGRGLGWKLMEWMLCYARSEGLKRIEGQVLPENVTMLKMCRELGFSVKQADAQQGIFAVSLPLS